MDVKKAGYGLCSMSRYIQMEKQDRCKWIVCTFDDGYEGLLHNAAPILNEFGFDATVFVCTDYIGQNNDWNYKDCHTRKHLSLAHLKELQSFGWEIGSHGVSHKSLLRLDDSEVDLQLSESKHILEAEFGPIKSYAYPYGDYSPYIESIVAKYYKYAFLLTQGGVFLDVDALRIHRYYISEINQIINVIS
jgi:peptidoglycan/xylan/chitin deacetylase (PgdA/CDA1 family)